MKKKPAPSLAEKLNILGKVIAAVLAYTLFIMMLSHVDAAPSGEQSEYSHYR
jgi:hypothetical protein